MNETKKWFFEKINNTEKSLVRLTEENKRLKIRNERYVKTDTTEVPKIVTDCLEQLYSSKLHNVEEMNKFIETYNLQILNHYETEKFEQVDY